MHDLVIQDGRNTRKYPSREEALVLQLGSYPKFRPQTKIRKILSIEEELICEWEDPDLMNRKNLFVLLIVIV